MQGKKEALRSIQRRILRIGTGLKKKEAELSECLNFRDTEHCGHLLQTHMHDIKERASTITLFDYGLNKERSIPLNPKKTAKEQPLLYFQKMKKQKRALVPLQKAIESIRKNLREWQKKYEFLQSLEKEEEIQKFIEENFQKPPKEKETVTTSKHEFFRFCSTSGCSIFVGKDATTSLYVTFHKAKGDDLWLHIQGKSGPHVIVKKNQFGKIDHEAFLDGAHLAIYMSKARSELHKEHSVSFTERKNVHPAGKKAKKGTVFLSKFETIVIRLDPLRIEKIKKRTQDSFTQQG